MISWRSTFMTSGKRRCRISALLLLKMLRQAIKSRSTRPIARRGCVFRIWSTNREQIFRVRFVGIILTLSRCRPERIICRRGGRSSNNAGADSVFDEKNRGMRMPMSIFAAEEFHDIAPPVDYSLIPPWLIFLGAFVSLTVIGFLVWFFVRGLRRPPHN